MNKYTKLKEILLNYTNTKKTHDKLLHELQHIYKINSVKKCNHCHEYEDKEVLCVCKDKLYMFLIEMNCNNLISYLNNIIHHEDGNPYKQLNYLFFNNLDEKMNFLLKIIDETIHNDIKYCEKKFSFKINSLKR